MCGIQNSIRGKPALRYPLGIIISILGFGCVSTEKAQQPDLKLIQTHFILEPGPVETQAGRLPDYFPIYAKIFAGEQVLDRKLVFRGWDFDKDGAIDMVEVLDKQGQVLRQAYDWNHDGQIDLVRD